MARPDPYNPRSGPERNSLARNVSEATENFMPILRRTHTCGELRDSHVGQTVVLNGWVNTYRGYHDQVFIDLRDRYG